MEGALGERLKREYALMPDDDVAWASSVYAECGRGALTALWREYIATAKKYGLPFAATTPTRRANKDRVSGSRYNKNIIFDNVRFLSAIRDTSDIEMYIGGMIGCKGDAYKAIDVLSVEESFIFHSWSAGLFASAGVDFLYAAIMPALSESIGIAMAMEATNLPYIISFMIRENGRLIDGTAIHDAIERIDGETDRKPIFYMTNCVHPTVLYKALGANFNRTNLVRERFCGIQANTSPLSPEELDCSAVLKCSDSMELSDDISKLRDFIRLKFVGGCCGTDNRYMEQMARLICN
jgi:S-methylmethionine-dependent homocysteine/selenocysteine methylase